MVLGPITACHGLSRSATLISDNARILVGKFSIRHGPSRSVTVCHGLLRGVPKPWQTPTNPDKKIKGPIPTDLNLFPK